MEADYRGQYVWGMSIFVAMFLGVAIWASAAISAEEYNVSGFKVSGVYEMNVVGSPEVRFHVTFWDEGIFGVSQPAENRTYATGHYKAKKQGSDIMITLLDDHHYVSGNSVTNIERHEWEMTLSGDDLEDLKANADIIVFDLNFNEQSRVNVDLVGKRLPEPPDP